MPDVRLNGLYEDQGLHAKATPLQRALAVFSVQGFHDRALPLHLRSLATREKVLGTDPDVATSFGNLATVYANLNRNSEVEPLYLRALSIREKSFGSEHPSVAQSLGNLAAHYFNQH